MRRFSWLLAPALVALPVGVQAASFEYEVRAGAAYSDNVERTAVDEIETAAAVVGLRVRGAREEGRLQYSLAGDASYLEYLDSEVPGEVIGSLFAESSYEILPQSFVWQLDGSFNQVRQDLLRAAAPGNRDDVLSLSTGPNLRARFGDAFEAELQARYAIADFSERDFDSDTLGAQLLLGRRFSERSVIGLGASFADVTYDSAIGLGSIDFQRTEVFARVRAEGARTEIQADVGYAQAEGANVDDSGAMIRLEATRRLTPFISGFVRYTQEYPTSEAAAFVPFDATGGGASGDASILTAAPRVAKSADIGLRLSRPRTSAELAFNANRETGLVGALGDRSFETARFSVTRSMTPRSRATVFAFWSQEDLGLVSESADELGIGGELSFTFGRHLGLDLRLEHRERDSALPASEFSEVSVGLFLRWGRISAGGRGPTVTPTALLHRGNP
jgi:hypothetical protein